MIYVNELKIGNYIESITLGEVIVSGIIKDDKGFYVIQCECGNETVPEECFGVKLTHKKLIQFGFKEYDSNNTFSKYGIWGGGEITHTLLSSENGSRIVYPNRYGAIKLEFAHELQNLMYSLEKRELKYI